MILIYRKIHCVFMEMIFDDFDLQEDTLYVHFLIFLMLLI